MEEIPMKEMETRKLMYHMIISIEMDLINFLDDKVTFSDIPERLMEKSEERKKGAKNIEEILQQLNLSDFIELINIKKTNTKLVSKEIEFLNNYLLNIIVPIRNRVMHPKPLEFNDFVILKNTVDYIDEKLPAIDWTNTIRAKQDINEHPEKVIKNSGYFSKEIIDNLPELNCEEIEFIGRKQEIAFLRKNLLDSKKSVISIVAAGGYGKTALALKVLNDFKNSGNCPFDIIVWTSFKTKSLNKTSFVDIEDNISNLTKMNKKVLDFINPHGTDVFKELIDLAKVFNVLLVFDNLETISSSEIIDFISDFMSYGKILITSRVSLGQLDVRYDLPVLNENDMIELTYSLLKYYHLDDRFTNTEILNLSKDILFSNPLSIKWAIRSLDNGLTINDIKEARKDVVDFCMENVYEKFDQISKRILHLLAFSNTPLTKGQIYFYMQSSEDTIPIIDDALSKLTSACFIDKALMRSGKFTLIEQAKIFIDSIQEVEGLKTNFKNRKKQLLSMYQELGIENEINAFDLFAINIYEKRDDILISAYYLKKAVELIKVRKNSEALSLVSMAEKISPSYSECYKIHALIMSFVENEDAQGFYEKALKCSNSSYEKSIILDAQSNHYIRNHRYQEALYCIDKAIELNDSIFLLLDKTKILNSLGKFDESIKLLDEIENRDFSRSNDRNIYITRRADTMRRMSELLSGKTQVDLRRKKLYDAFKLIEKQVEFDDYMLEMLCKIISDLFNLKKIKNYEKECAVYLLSNIDILNKLKGFLDIKESLKRVIGFFDKEISDSLFLKFYNIDINELKDENIGLVTYAKDDVAFIINSKYRNGVYFKNNLELCKGDKVKFTMENYEMKSVEKLQ